MFFGFVLAALGGLVMGSLSQLVAWRLPRGESLVRPGPRCASCEHAIGPKDLIPVVAWLRLHGRCRDCDAAISRRHHA